MADHLVDGSADALRVAFKIKGSRDAAHLYRIFMDQGVDILCADARTYEGIHQIEDLRIHLAGLSDPLDLRRGLNHVMLRHQIAHNTVIFNLSVERQMTVLILLSAAAPAGVISS